jgi:hypothetical protein
LALWALVGFHHDSTLVVPGFTAYGAPDPDALDVSESGVRNWSDSSEHIQWHGRIAAAGELSASVVVKLPSGETTSYRLKIGNRSLSAQATGSGDAPVIVSFGKVSIPKAGYQTFDLSGQTKSGATFGDIVSLSLSGPAVTGAHFNLKSRRNTASVHLNYPFDPTLKPVWFYNEVTPKLTPLYTYYEVCGFGRGYFGIQVNSPTERRIIFSVWNSGTGNDPSKVNQDDKVDLVAKGPGVFAGEFGNEGTGGHSHLVYPWKVDHTYRFLVNAAPDGDKTVYSGYFFDPEQGHWVLIASFRAPKDGGVLRGLYSFDEGFGGSSGDQERLAEFGNAWIGMADGSWRSLTQAKFTHDPTGKADRLDYAGGAKGDRFFLRTGGFLDEDPTPYGSIFIRTGGTNPPHDIFLPQN